MRESGIGRGAAALALASALAGALGGCLPSPPRAEVTAVADAGDAVLVTVVSRGRPSGWLIDDGAGLRGADPATVAAQPPQEQQCADADCYRVVPGRLQVQESHDGGATYATAWEISGDTYRALARSYRLAGDPAPRLSALSLVVHAVAGGHVVFVANGLDGVLYRDTRGRWRRLGVPMGGEGSYFEDAARLATDPPGPDPRPYVAAVAGLLVLLAAAIAAVVRRRPATPGRAATPRGAAAPRGAGAVLGIAVAAAGIGWLAGRLPAVGMFPGALYSAVIIGPTTVVAVALAIRIAGRRR